MDRFHEVIKRYSSVLDNRVGMSKFAVVQSYNPSDHTARVLFQPEAVLSGWLPIASPMVGPNWGFVSPMVPGQQVMVVPMEGDVSNGVIVGSLFSSASLPPSPQTTIDGGATPVQPGQIALVHQSGATIRLCADGSVFIQSPTALNIQAPNTNMHGNLLVSGDISDAHGKLNDLRSDYDAHQHNVIGVQPGGATIETTAPINHTEATS